MPAYPWATRSAHGHPCTPPPPSALLGAASWNRQTPSSPWQRSSSGFAACPLWQWKWYSWTHFPLQYTCSTVHSSQDCPSAHQLRINLNSSEWSIWDCIVKTVCQRDLKNNKHCLTYNHHISVFETADDFCPFFCPAFFNGVHTVGVLYGMERPSINHPQVHKFEQEGDFTVVIAGEENVASQHEVPC